jgi:hypothetical protein
MNRIFKSLAAVTVIFVIGTFLLGLSIELGDINDRKDLVTQSRATMHRLTGIAAGMFVILINSVAVTYFVGTTRWVKEVCDTYGIDQANVVRSTLLKRASFPWAVMGMLVPVVIVAMGGAADPSATTKLPLIAGIEWKWMHLVTAGLGLFTIIWAFMQQSYYMSENQAVIGRVMVEVKKIRSERGLDVDG